MESTATKDRLCCAMALMNSTILKTRKQKYSIYLNEMLTNWSKKSEVKKVSSLAAWQDEISKLAGWPYGWLSKLAAWQYGRRKCQLTSVVVQKTKT